MPFINLIHRFSPAGISTLASMQVHHDQTRTLQIDQPGLRAVKTLGAFRFQCVSISAAAAKVFTAFFLCAIAVALLTNAPFAFAQAQKAAQPDTTEKAAPGASKKTVPNRRAPSRKSTSSSAKSDLEKDFVLKIANLGKPVTLDPHAISSAWEARIVGDLFVGLVTEGPDASIVPGVAKSWEVSDDKRTWTFKLRKSFWSDYRPLTASDFEYSFKRAVTPGTRAFFAPGLYAIKNAYAIHNRKLKNTDELGIRALDDETLEITLEVPDAFFLEQLTHPIAYPVPQHQIEGLGSTGHNDSRIVNYEDYAAAIALGVDDDSISSIRPLISNGPYRLERWMQDGQVRAIKNLAFYDWRKVRIDTVHYDPDTDLDKAVEKFTAGEVHISRDIGVKDIDKLLSSREDETHITPYLGVYYFSLNLSHRPFQSKSVRLALAMGIDRETITDKVLRTGETPAYSLIPPGVTDYETSTSVEWRYQSNEERLKLARALMEKAGYNQDNPLKITLNFNIGDDNHERIALAATAMWKKIHVNASVVSRSVAQHYELLQGGRFQVGRASWLSQHNDASSFLSLLHSEVGNLNYGRFKHEEFDQLLEKAASTPVGKGRQRLFAKAEKILLEEQPVIPIYHYASRNLVSSKIKGWTDNTKDVQRTRYLSLQ